MSTFVVLDIENRGDGRPLENGCLYPKFGFHYVRLLRALSAERNGSSRPITPCSITSLLAN
jgi:hypothetical protein